jgi:hypothetical protein
LCLLYCFSVKKSSILSDRTVLCHLLQLSQWENVCGTNHLNLWGVFVTLLTPILWYCKHDYKL